MEIVVSKDSVGAILESADRVLDTYGKEGVPENIKGQATVSALKNMFGGRSFSILTVDKLAEQNNVSISNEHYEFMRTLHCVDFTDMTQETKEYLMALLVDYFRSNISMVNASPEI